MLRRMILSVSTGVVIALAIFLAISNTPWPSSKSDDSTSDIAISAIHTTLVFSSFSMPQGLGSEAILTIEVSSLEDSANVSVHVNLPEGLLLVTGDLDWNVDLKENVSDSRTMVIRAVQVGNWTVSATARWYIYDDSWEGDSDIACVCVSEDSISVIRKIYWTPDVLPDIPSNMNELEPS